MIAYLLTSFLYFTMPSYSRGPVITSTKTYYTCYTTALSRKLYSELKVYVYYIPRSGTDRTRDLMAIVLGIPGQHMKIPITIFKCDSAYVFGLTSNAAGWGCYPSYINYVKWRKNG